MSTMLKAGVGADTTRYNTVIKACAGLLPPSVVSCNATISACEKGKHWEGALRLLQEMLHQLLTPDVVCYSAAISACEKGQQ
jgi:pentatricopeptide repeat protein